MEKCAPGGGQLLGNPRKTPAEKQKHPGKSGVLSISFSPTPPPHLGRGAFVGGTVWFPTTFERSDSAAETRPQATGLHRKPLWPKATDAFSLIHLELFLIQTERLRFDLLTYGALSNRV